MTGGINTWRSLAYGNTGSWNITSMWNDYTGTIGYTHADIHNLDINPLNNYLYCCSDGGLLRSTDFGSNWTDLSDGLEITQWYRIAGYEANSNLLIGETQDNGSNKWTGGLTIQHILGADGMDCMIDHTNSNTMYYSSQGGALRKSTNDGASWLMTNTVAVGCGAMAMGTNNTSRIYAAEDNNMQKKKFLHNQF